MRSFTIQHLAEVTCAPAPAGPQARAVCTGVSTDSRMVQPGDCFFALRGDTFDGHAFIAHAFDKGAVCCVVDHPVEVRPGQGTILQVKDTTLALGDLARAYRKQAGFQVIGITGSVGKTTTRHLIAHCLAKHYRVAQSPKNFNNAIGLPVTLLGAAPDAQVMVAELGTNHPGEIRYLTGIASPDIAVVTNCHPAHLEGFGSVEAIRKEKLSILDGLKPGGQFVTNADQPGLVEACQAKGYAPVTFGLSAQAQIRAMDIRYQGPGSSFTLDGTRIDLPLPGPGNILNCLAALAVCRHLGVSLKAFTEAVAVIQPATMRSEVLRLGTLTVINDCYNANPASMKNALEILRWLQPGPGARRVFVCGTMGELGNQAEALHRDLGLDMAQAELGLVIAVGPLPKLAAQTAAKHAPSLRIACFEDTISACQGLQDLVQHEDIVLVKGSRIARLEQVTERLGQIENNG